MNSIRLFSALSIVILLAGCVAYPVYQQVPAGTAQPAPPVVYVQPAPVYYYPPVYYPYYWGPPVGFSFSYRGGHRR